MLPSYLGQDIGSVLGWVTFLVDHVDVLRVGGRGVIGQLVDHSAQHGMFRAWQEGRRREAGAGGGRKGAGRGRKGAGGGRQGGRRREDPNLINFCER